jgi:hypothetical protein
MTSSRSSKSKLHVLQTRVSRSSETDHFNQNSSIRHFLEIATRCNDPNTREYLVRLLNDAQPEVRLLHESEEGRALLKEIKEKYDEKMEWTQRHQPFVATTKTWEPTYPDNSPPALDLLGSISGSCRSDSFMTGFLQVSPIRTDVVTVG